MRAVRKSLKFKQIHWISPKGPFSSWQDASPEAFVASSVTEQAVNPTAKPSGTDSWLHELL
jgi:hypothetical protein